MRTVAAILLTLLGGCGGVPSCAPRPAPFHPAEVWAWCGPDPADPGAYTALLTLRAIGVTSVHGPCRRPGTGYTATDPGARYASPAEYRALVLLAAQAGLTVIVYDPRVWGTPDDQQAALADWGPSMPYVRGWDMGDEIDPASPADWGTLTARWATVRNGLTGRPPLTNHLPWALDNALRDLPGDVLSFDSYDPGSTVRIAATYRGRAPHLACYVNTLTFGPFTPTPDAVARELRDVVTAGCDIVGIFTGMPPDAPGLTGRSLVDVDGSATPIGRAVATALGKT